MLYFFGPTLIESGQSKVLTYKPRDVDPPFRIGHFTVPRHLDGLNDLTMESVQATGMEKPFTPHPIPMAAFSDEAVGFNLGLPEVRYGGEATFIVKNNGKKGCLFVATLTHVDAGEEKARWDAMMAASRKQHQQFEGARSPGQRKIVEARETVIGIGPIVIPDKSDSDDAYVLVDGKAVEKHPMPYQRRPDQLLWTVKATRFGHLEKWDEFIPNRLIIPSAVAEHFNILDVNLGGRGQRAFEAMLTFCAKRTETDPTLPPGGRVIGGDMETLTLEPFPAAWVDELSSIRNENLNIKVPFRFITKLKRGSGVSIDIENTAKEPKTFSCAIIGTGIFYDDNLIEPLPQDSSK